MIAPVKTKPPRSGPPHLSRELGKLMASLAQKSGALDPRLAGSWAQIVGPDLAKICRPIRLKKLGRAQILEIAVSNGAAAMQIQFKQDSYCKKLMHF